MNTGVRIIALVLLIGLPFFVYDSIAYARQPLFDSVQSEPYLLEDFDACGAYSKALEQEGTDISAWEEGGVITLWAHVDDRRDMDRIDLVLIDSHGKEAVLEGLQNVGLDPSENMIKQDDAFLDFFLEDNQTLLKWEDFMIVDGTNLLIYQFNSSLGLDMSNITYWVRPSPYQDILLVEKPRIQPGLTRHKNPAGGKWYSPHGLPQFGVFWCEAGWMRLRNVRQTQYPSNGDHTRIISEAGTPSDFVMRVRFRIDEVGTDYTRFIPTWLRKGYTNPRKNTFFRVAYDFEDKYDPGHDQAIAFFSFQYNRFGLQRVYPVTRFFEQAYEPHIASGIGTDQARLEKGKTYELDMKVIGQSTRAELYEVRGERLKRIADAEYDFTRERLPEGYPFSFEFTGDVSGAIDMIEIRTIA